MRRSPWGLCRVVLLSSRCCVRKWIKVILHSRADCDGPTGRLRRDTKLVTDAVDAARLSHQACPASVTVTGNMGATVSEEGREDTRGFNHRARATATACRRAPVVTRRAGRDKLRQHMGYGTVDAVAGCEPGATACHIEHTVDTGQGGADSSTGLAELGDRSIAHPWLLESRLRMCVCACVRVSFACVRVCVREAP
jgi:hypothetical protein